MQYHVLLNLNRDLIDYEPGQTVDLPDDAAQDLLDAGVVSGDAPVIVVAEPEVEQQPEAQPEVGGAPASTGEPSLDTQATQTSPTEATDVTPVLEDMTRAELDAHAADKGIAPEVIDAAPNKAAVIDLINTIPATPESDPSANL